MSKSVRMSQCEGRLQFPWLHGVTHITPEAAGSFNSSGWSLCRWEILLLDKGMHDMRSRKENKQPGLSLMSSSPQRHSQVPNLSICGHLSVGRREGRWGNEPPFSFLNWLSAFHRGQFSPWVGTGHIILLWAVQSKGHSQTCGQCLKVSPVFRLDHSCVCGRG